MTDREAKSIVVERLKPETTLIFMNTPHAKSVTIGTVPFVLTDDAYAPPMYDVHSFDGQRLLKYNGIVYAIKGYGPTDSMKQRAIVEPYAP